MTKQFVKKPFFVVVAVVIILAIGGVSLTKMQTDLLPEFELPYLAVITTDIGASPEEVEQDVVEPLEGALGTISGVENIYSTSANNYGMIMMQFADDINMDAAMVRVSTAASSVELPEGCGTPNIMELSMDMMASMYATVSYKGMDIKELSSFTDKTIVPSLERLDGVASVTAVGLIEDTVEVRLNEDKIRDVNKKILAKTNKKLGESQDELDDAKSKLKKGKKELEKQQDKLKDTQQTTTDKLADATVQLTKAQATKAAYESQLGGLKANQSALQAEKKAYQDAALEDSYNSINQLFQDVDVKDDPNMPKDMKDAVEHQDKFDAFIAKMQSVGKGDWVANLSYEGIKQIYQIVAVRMPQIDTEVANLGTEITAQEMIISQLTSQMANLDDAHKQVVSGSISAAIGFGSGQAQIASGISQMASAEDQIKSAQEQLDKAIDAALENANVDALVNIDTLSNVFKAQSFKMPAGYVDDQNDTQWLIEIGEKFQEDSELANLVLMHMDEVGDIKLSDVADIVVVDNQGEGYTKLNGDDAVLLAVYKTSTASTSEVTDRIVKSFDESEEKYDGLVMTALMNQGDYIDQVIKSVLSSILLGAILAIVVLALFLKDVMPTIVVAFSIPFSVLFAIIVMYFTGININVMSLAGLCIGIGMLVDNSIVVMENIYRLRNRGIAAPRAAVQGTRQVAGPIIASTITTICVFFPMVYTSGTVAQLLYPFAFTISYALFASLLIALTVVPTMGSVFLRKTKRKKQPFFDRIQKVYGKLLGHCLRHKLFPLLIAIGLLVASVISVTKTGLVMIDSMESDQINVNLTLPEDSEKDNSFEKADQVAQAILAVDGVEKVGAMSGGASSVAVISGMSAASSDDDFHSFQFMVLTKKDVKTTEDFRKIRKQIEKNTKDIECEEISVSSSAMGNMSSMMGGGMEVNIYGDEEKELIKISEDVMDMMKSIKGVTETDNGITDENRVVRLSIDRNKAAEHGLTVAQIFQQVAGKAKTEGTSIAINMDQSDVDIKIVDETEKLTYENLMDFEIEATEMNDDGESENNTYKLSEFASKEDGYTVNSISRENQKKYLTVTAQIDEDENATLLARKLEKKINKYDVPSGYSVEISGESTNVNEMMRQMLLATALGFLLVYLVMVAQFQSLLSPFIIIFTVPLAFTGGMIGLKLFHQSISAMAMMGFMILMGTVVNNGIVFVDYTNQLRKRDVPKHKALIATGKTRMRPILMTAITTILSMSVMVVSKDAGNAMQKGMAIVVCFGLIYATFMTLFIVPIMYDILYRRKPKDIDVGDDLDDIPDEVSELLESDVKEHLTE